ncbi:MAG: RimK/LysX family protein [Candidatus Pacebacteria bacterium]|nr:RimK/LysX family protein [Candidatus Paceibacterota bacterium]
MNEAKGNFDKQILGIIENVKIYHRVFEKDKIIVEKEPKGFVEIKAKIDTGAEYSSIDKNLAIELGYGDVIDEFDKRTKDFIVNSEIENDVLTLRIKNELEKWGDAFNAKLIKSSHGASYRLMIKMDIVLANVTIHTFFSVIDRGHMQFPVLIGRKSMKFFLVDPSKFPGEKYEKWEIS